MLPDVTPAEALAIPLGTAELRVGLLAGVFALVASLILPALRRRDRDAAGGLLLAALVAALLIEPVGRPAPPWLGLVLLLAAGTVRRWRPAAAVWLVPAAVGVFLLTARLGEPTSGWRLAVTLLGLLVVAAVVRFDAASAQRELGTALLALTAAGIYITVPDTEQALVLLGVALPLALLGWPLRRGAFGVLAAPAVGGVLVWVAATGGVGRESSVVGALAAAGLLLAEPASRLLRGTSILDRVPARWWAGAGLLVVQAVAALIAGRVAGLQPTLTVAAAIAVVLLGTLTLLLVLPAQRGRVPRKARK